MGKLDAQEAQERRKRVHHVKYLVNDREPGAIKIANEMRAAGVQFTTLPTSGPVTIIVDGFASYGPEGVKHVAEHLITGERARGGSPR